MFCLALLCISAAVFTIPSTNASTITSDEEVIISPNEYVTLIFPPGSEIEHMTANETAWYPPLSPPSQGDMGACETLPSNGFIGSVWEIKVTGMFEGLVRVILVYPNESSPTEILQTDVVPGDLNLDSYVGVDDLVIAGEYFGSTPISSRWNVHADLNEDDYVGIDDVVLMARNFGQTSEWAPLSNTYVNYEAHFIEGDTDHFSVFGVH